ncbi:MAG TPA: hypothetical protein VFG11_09220 [Acidobacteriota bacterium]|nr:hypothetical protein [Acidobacteriota bacterium]
MTDPMRISSQTPMAPAKITEDIVLDELQTPLAKGEDRFERMKEIFQNLNPDDAKALLDRLQSNNQNDPLTAQFNAAFGGQKAEDLKAVLQAKFQGGPADSAPANQPAQPLTPAQSRGIRSEIGFQGSVWQAQISGQLSAQSNPTVDQAKNIIADQSLKPDQKTAQMQKLLENASPNDFQALFSDAAGLKDDPTFQLALGQSEKGMERFAKEIPADTQAAILKDLQGFKDLDQASFDKFQKNLVAWAKNANPETLNKVMDKVPFIADALAEQTGFNDQGALVNKLSDKNKGAIINASLNRNPLRDEDKQLILIAYNSMKPEARNAVIDKLEDAGKMPGLLRAFGSLFDSGQLEGLNKENVQMVQSTFELLAREADRSKQGDLASMYDEKALMVKGYIKNHFHG